MHNLVEKYTPAVEATEDDGVVAIEYVLVAGLVAIGVAITFGSSLWTDHARQAQRPVHLRTSRHGRGSASCPAPTRTPCGTPTPPQQAR